MTIDDGDDAVMEDLNASFATIMVDDTQDYLFGSVKKVGTVIDVAYDGNCGHHALIKVLDTTGGI